MVLAVYGRDLDITLTTHLESLMMNVSSNSHDKT